MTIETYKLFPTLVLKANKFLSLEQTGDIFYYCLKQNNMGHPAILGDGSSSHLCNYNLLEQLETDLDSCTGIAQKILDFGNHYAQTAGISQVKINGSWFNIQNKNSNLFQHMHPGSILSCVLFINCDQESSKLFFYNPNPLVNYTTEYSNNLTEYSYGVYSIKPEIGDLIIFPGWLYHGSYTEFNTTVNRMVISCNFKYKE
jgi:uncharacterized protein (TIGR02466 family)